MTIETLLTSETTPPAQTAQVEPNDPLLQLVGEGKKFKTLDDLARGKVEADNYIMTLKKQIEELQKQVDTSKKVEDVLAKLAEAPVRTGKTVMTGETQMSAGTGATTIASNDGSDIETLVEQKLAKRERENQTTLRLKDVADQMTKLYGDKAGEVLTEKAKSLGLSFDKLRDIAVESPQAFMVLIKTGEKAEQAAPAQGRTINTTALFDGSAGVAGGERDFNWYMKLRKEDPKRYRSPQIQAQMFADRERLGPKFGV